MMLFGKSDRYKKLKNKLQVLEQLIDLASIEKKFAFVPIKLYDGRYVWLQTYYQYQDMDTIQILSIHHKIEMDDLLKPMKLKREIYSVYKAVNKDNLDNNRIIRDLLDYQIELHEKFEKEKQRLELS